MPDPVIIEIWNVSDFGPLTFDGVPVKVIGLVVVDNTKLCEAHNPDSKDVYFKIQINSHQDGNLIYITDGECFWCATDPNGGDHIYSDEAYYIYDVEVAKAKEAIAEFCVTL